MDFIQYMFKNEFYLESWLDTIDNFKKEVGVMMERGILEEKPDGLIGFKNNKPAKYSVMFMDSLILPFIDSYWACFVLLFCLFPNEEVKESRIKQRLHMTAEDMHDDRIISYYESCSVDTLYNALKHFESIGIVGLF